MYDSVALREIFIQRPVNIQIHRRVQRIFLSGHLIALQIHNAYIFRGQIIVGNTHGLNYNDSFVPINGAYISPGI